MATGFEVIPETAKALSAPLTKLVEVIAAGCGKAYGPTDIRRTAKAQAEASLILAEAEAQRSEIALRAVHRLLDVEEARQKNIDAIAGIASKQLPDEVSDVPVQQDWTARFFREAQDVSNEQMQQLWGRLLSGEVAKPGSYSVRTLAVVSNLSPHEAAKFGSVCEIVSEIFGTGLFTFLTDLNSPLSRSKGLSYDVFQELEAAGLVKTSEIGKSLTFNQPNAEVHISRPGNVLFIAKGTLANVPAGALPVGNVSLTPAGAELYRIAEPSAWPDYDDEIAKTIAAVPGWTVEKKLVIERMATQIRHVPWPL